MSKEIDEKILEMIHLSKQNDPIDLTKEVYINESRLEFSRVFLFQEKLSILLPESFVDMPPNLAALKYPSNDRPQIIKSNLETSVNFAFSYFPETPMSENDAKQLRDYMQLITTKMNTSVKLLDSFEDQTLNTTMSVFQYRAPAIDEPIFYTVYVTPIHGCALVGFFNCPDQQAQDWHQVSKQVLQSIRDETQPEEEGDPVE